MRMGWAAKSVTAVSVNVRLRIPSWMEGRGNLGIKLATSTDPGGRVLLVHGHAADEEIRRRGHLGERVVVAAMVMLED